MRTGVLPSTQAFLRVALWSVLLSVVAFTRTDPDLWGHVRFGVDIVHDGGLSHADPYSFTSDRPWINHEWASELAMGAAFLGADGTGLVLLKLLVIGASLLLLDRTLRREGVVEGRHRDWIGAAAVITTVQQAHHVRPQLFSLLFFSVLLACLSRASTREGWRWLLPIPVLFGVWANFHGGWIVGGAVLFLWTLGSAFSRCPDRIRLVALLCATGGASLAATLVNPYGFGLWHFLQQTVGTSRAEITDWQPVYVLSPAVWILWIVTAAIALFGIVRARRTSIEWRRVLVVAALAIASFQVNRLLAFFALATLFLFGAALMGKGEPSRVAARESGTRQNRAAAIAIASIMLAGGCVALALNLLCLRIDARTTPEPEAVTILQRQAGGRLLVWFDWGEYAIWHLGPRMRVSIDGRRETVYSARVQDRHLRFFFDAPGGGDLPAELQADFVWIPKHLPAVRGLDAGGWTHLYDGEQSVIFARPGTSPASVTAAAEPAHERCFPGR